MHTLTHYTAEPFTLDRTRTYTQGSTPNGKPLGLWLSDDTDLGWAEWCRSEEFHLHGLEHRTQFTIADDANILHLSTVAEIAAFTDEWGTDDPYVPDLRWRRIDWVSVAERYDGILITPYQWEARYEFMWYSGWDVASGCFWNLDAIRELEAVRS